MNRRSTLVLGLLLSALATSATLLAQAPDPNQPYVESIAFGGTGCFQGTVAGSISGDGTSFLLMFDQFIARTGHGVPATESRKNCQLVINVHLPDGSGQFCAALNYRGSVQLPAGVRADSVAAYHFGEVIEDDPIANLSQEYVGPIDTDYVRRDSVTLDWSLAEPSIKPIFVNSQVRIMGLPEASAQITTDSIRGRLTPGPCPAVDTTAPTITIASPAPFGLYGLGASVTPVFACQDDEGGSGIESCTGAALLDTSSIGPKTFTITAVDFAGNTSTASVTYAVGGKEECLGGGYSNFLVPTFANLGLCVSAFVP